MTVKGVLKTNVQMVHAECHTDDGAHRVYFNATPWVAQAKFAEILRLAGAGWGGDGAAAAARFMRGQDIELDKMFAYLDLVSGTPKGCGFKCLVNRGDVHRWVQDNWPLRWPKLYRLDGPKKGAVV